MKKRSDQENSTGYQLVDGPHGLELRSPQDRSGTGVRLDTTWVRHALQRGAEHLRGDPLARALATPFPAQGVIIDATAGLGGDSLLFAALGLQVIAFERQSTVFELLRDGLSRLRDDEELGTLIARIDLRCGDARTLIPSLEVPPDYIYIDPMFPPKRRESALPPKALQALRAIVGSDADSTHLLEIALASAARKVIVKRPNGAAPLAAAPASSHQGKTVHYDVYIPRG